MRDRDNILEVAALQPDYLGLIFYPPSPRYVPSSVGFPAEELDAICTIGVFVDEQEAVILEKVNQFGLKGVQLHGQESPEVCARLKALGLKVLKAIPVADSGDLQLARQYEGCVDLIVLDTKTEAHGGSGQKFNWQLLADYDAEIPFLLSGGICAEDVDAVGLIRHPLWAGLDLNSRFEIDKGLKNVALLDSFLQQLSFIFK